MGKFRTVAAVVVASLAMTVIAASQNPVTEAGKQAKHGASSAGKAVKEGAEAGYNKTKEGAEKAYDATKEAVTGSTQDKPDQTQSDTQSVETQQPTTKTRTLPQTASCFPLLGLLGFAMTAVGVWKTRLRT